MFYVINKCVATTYVRCPRPVVAVGKRTHFPRLAFFSFSVEPSICVEPRAICYRAVESRVAIVVQKDNASKLFLTKSTIGASKSFHGKMGIMVSPLENFILGISRSFLNCKKNLPQCSKTGLLPPVAEVCLVHFPGTFFVVEN